MSDHTIERVKEIIETITLSYDNLKEFEKIVPKRTIRK